MIIVSTGSGTVTNINTALPLSGGPITTSGTITTSMATNKLIGRSTAGTGVMEEITVGTGLSLTGGTLSSTGGGAAGSTNEIQFNNAAAFAASANLRWIIADNRLLLGTENIADTNSRMVIIGKGISTQNTFAVHNSTGTNNALVVRDDGFVGIGTNVPGNGGGKLSVRGDIIAAINTTGILNIGAYTQSGNANERAKLTLRAGDSSTSTTYEVTSVPNNASGVSIVEHQVTPSVGLGGQSSLRFTTGNGSNSSFIFRFDTTELMRIRRNSVLIGTTTDVPSSILTLESTTKGFLPPRMTTAERDLIATPAVGLLIYNTTTNKFSGYDGTNWHDFH